MPLPANKRVLLGVTGGIAAYKTPHLVRLLKKAGMDVRVLMTPSAHRFVTAETLATVSGHPVLTDFFRGNSGEWNNHVEMGLWAEVMIIAPATASTLGKMANGISDNLLITTYLSARCPVFVSPAMDLDMYKHPAVNDTLNRLKQHGVRVIPAATGPLASGLEGQGRMPEPEEIIEAVFGKIRDTRLPLSGKKVMVSAGPTYENIDPVRFIGNHSSGKMGYAIAEAFEQQGADVTLVSGPVHLQAPSGVNCIRVMNAQSMYDACLAEGKDADVIVMAAAVADYRPAEPAADKIKKTGDHLVIELVKNPDILAELGRRKTQGQVLVGFALETSNEMEHAREKLARKNLDMVIMNSLRDEKAGFGHDTNKVTIISANGQAQHLPLKSKQEVARDIVQAIVALSKSN